MENYSLTQSVALSMYNKMST